LWYEKRDIRPPAMPDFLKLPTWANKGCVYAVVETPRGSRAKLDFDPKLSVFTLTKPLMAGLSYPYDWVSYPRPGRKMAIPWTPSLSMTRRPTPAWS
jgi:hypothetical protein